MTNPLKLMCVFEHPDDESLATGGILSRYVDEGVETAVIPAARRAWSRIASEKKPCRSVSPCSAA